MTLKTLDGFDVGGEYLTFQAFKQQYTQIKNELEFNSRSSKHEIKSVFEIGCGSGANLYLFQQDGIKTGGIDYSDNLSKIARGILNNCEELICGEAVNTPASIKYDSVLSNSVFSYFPDYDYALKVLEIMYSKSNYSIGIIDVHDVNKKEAFTQHRLATVENYAEIYKGLDKLFYSRDLFMNFAEKHGLNIRFAYSDVPRYWNNEFIFNVFMTKEAEKG